jgi:hypothetical protein
MKAANWKMVRYIAAEQGKNEITMAIANNFYGWGRSFGWQT